MLMSEECLHSVRGDGESHQHDAKQRIMNILLLCYLPVCPKLLVDKLLVCRVHGSLTPAFVAICCSTNGEGTQTWVIYVSVVLNTSVMLV